MYSTLYQKTKSGWARASALILATIISVVAGLLNASATLTPYAWYQMGEADQVLPQGWLLDSTTNHILFGPDAFFDNRVSLFANAVVITNVAAGGPLGPNRITSTESLRTHYAPFNGNGGMAHGGIAPIRALPYGLYPATADVNGYVTPAGWSWQQNSNWVMEAWILPIGNGVNSGGEVGHMLSTGCNNSASTTANGGSGRTNWGVQLATISTNYDGTKRTGNIYLTANCFGPTDTHVGPHGLANNLDTNGLPWNYVMMPPILIATLTNNAWMHIAVVRDSQAVPGYQFYLGEKGTVTIYTNGVAMWSTNASRVWQAAMLQAPFTPFFNQQGPCIMGNRNSNYNSPFNGYIDEVRFSSFTGPFSTGDLLLRSIPGPGIVKEPSNATVYAGNPAPFQVIAAFDSTLTYQWWKVVGTTLTALPGGVISTSPQLIVPASAYSSGDKFVCAVSCSGFNPGTVYTTTNTVTTIANPAAIGVYNAAVQATPGLISYFPGDTDNPTGTTLTDVKSGNNGTLSGNVAFDGTTSRFAGGQGLTFNRDGELAFNVNDDVKVPANSAYDFASGFGTVEAVLYMDPAALKQPWPLNWPYSGYGFTWLSASDLNQQGTYTPGGLQPGGGIESLTYSNQLAFRYVLSMDTVGNIIYYAGTNQTSLNSQPNGGPAFNNPPLFWAVPGGTVGRRLHVAITIDNTTNVTCYVNGQNLGTLQQTGFGPATGLPLHIGNANYTPIIQNDLLIDNVTPSPARSQGWIPAVWYGSIDEVALYSTNLTPNQVAIHAYKLINGSSGSAATATILTPSKSMFAGGSETFNALAGGEPPWNYSWTTNGIVVTGQTNSQMTLNNLRGTVSVRSIIQGSVGSPATSAPCVITITTPAVGSYAAQVFSNAPVAFYRFNESSGTACYDWAGSHDGVYNGPTTTYAKNVAGPAAGEGGFHAYGTNAPSSRTEVRIPYSADLMGWASPTNAFSYEVWFKPDFNAVDQTVFSARMRRGNNKAGVTILYNGDGEGVANEDIVNNNFQYRYGKYFNIQQTSDINNANTTAAPTNVWHHLVVTFDGSLGTNATGGFTGNRTVWYDGIVWNKDIATVNAGDILNGSNQGSFQLNRFASLIIGNCPDSEPTANQNRPIVGTVSDMAVYNYELSTNQVLGHYSAYFTAAVVTNSPVGVTTNESYQNSITLTAVVGGNGNHYQWYVTNATYPGGLALSGATVNADGTLHYPPVSNGVFDTVGVDAPVLTITEVTAADTGTYALVIFNQLNTPSGFISTHGAAVTVIPDTTKPVVNYAAGLGQYIYGSTASPGTVQVRFSKRVSVASATLLGNYSINGGAVAINNIFIAQTAADTLFGGDYRTVTLQTGPLTPGQTYSLAISGIQDQAATPNTMLPATVSFTAPVTQQGLVWDYYSKNSGTFGSAMGNLTDGQYNDSPIEFGTVGPVFGQTPMSFPYCPQYETTLSSFDTVPLNLSAYNPNNTGLGGNPVFGTGVGTGSGINYGALISGWITPTVTDDYTFFVEDDDSAALFLSSDATPGNGLMIAQATGVHSTFLEPGSDHATSAPQHLVAGTPYWIELIFVQAAGNDYARVAWRGASDSTPAANLQPIPGSVLSSWGAAKPVLNLSQSGGNVTLSWNGGGVLLQSTNVNAPLNQWTPVPGTPYPTSPYTTPASGTQMYYRVAH